MNRTSWNHDLKAAVRDMKTNPSRAASTLRRLSAAARRAARLAVSEWHAEEALGMAAVALSHGKAHAESAALYRQLANRYRLRLQFYGHAHATALALQAIELFEAGALRHAQRVAQQAVRQYAAFPEQHFVRDRVDTIAQLSPSPLPGSTKPRSTAH